MSEPPDIAIYRVRHHYRYVYSGPVRAMRQRLVMIPPDHHGDQELESFDVDIRGTSGGLAIDWDVDSFGNRVCRVSAEHIEHAVDFEARFTVQRRVGSTAIATVPHGNTRAYCEYTALTAPDERILSAATEIAAITSQPSEQIARALDWSADAIVYRSGVTGTQTPAAMALHLGAGVCQDYAHIMLSLLRTLGHPACYVSGHLLGDGAPHAWVEAFVDGQCHAYDPTHRRPANLNYITVAVGRDFSDVTMTSGVFSGAAAGQLHWSKSAERIDGDAARAVIGVAA
ncbi:MAG: hypothetical protein NVSMB2_24870 [Chloroflexota bacterium]